jgi:hypothetical protein
LRSPVDADATMYLVCLFTFAFAFTLNWVLRAVEGVRAAHEVAMREEYERGYENGQRAALGKGVYR